MAANKNIIIGLLSLCTLGSGVLAWYEHEQVAALQSRFDEANGLNADWKKRLAAAQQHAQDLENSLAAARHSADAAHKEDLAANEASARNWRNRRDPEGRFGDFLSMMDDPKLAKLMATQERGQLDSRYAALFKNLKLSPQDLEKFKDLLVEKQNSMRDVMTAARAQGLDPRQDRAAFQQLVAQSNAELDANIQSTLGIAAFTQYQQYEQTMPERNLVSQLDQRLSYSSTPLNADQQEALVQALAQTAPPSNGSNPGRGGPGGPRFNVTDQSIAQASTVLTPDQVTALQQLQQEQQAQRQLFQQMRQQQQGQQGQPTNGGGAGPAAPITSPGTGTPRPTG